MRLILSALAVAAAVWLVAWGDPQAILRWAIAEQRDFQNRMAGAIRAIQAGEGGAWAALLGAAGAYGFVHALGPGHGKIVIGGVGLGVNVGTGRLLSLAVISSLAQALWAILLVYGGFALFEVSARRLTALVEDMLAPAGYVAIAAIGAILFWRGARALRLRVGAHDRHHAGCGCAGHGPAPEDVARLASWREGAALVLSIAIRPCTGAVFLLVIAWQMDLHAAGAAAVLVMGLGTAALTGLVAVSATATRGLATISGAQDRRLGLAAPVVQIAAGGVIVWASLGLLL